MQFAIFPTDKHEGLGKYVARVINMFVSLKAEADVIYTFIVAYVEFELAAVRSSIVAVENFNVLAN